MCLAFEVRVTYLMNGVEILQIRKGMWATVASRLHTPMKIFPFGAGSDEVMIYGTVAYTLKDGRRSDVSIFFSWCS